MRFEETSPAIFDSLVRVGWVFRELYKISPAVQGQLRKRMIGDGKVFVFSVVAWRANAVAACRDAVFL